MWRVRRTHSSHTVYVHAYSASTTIPMVVAHTTVSCQCLLVFCRAASELYTKLFVMCVGVSVGIPMVDLHAAGRTSHRAYIMPARHTR